MLIRLGTALATCVVLTVGCTAGEQPPEPAALKPVAPTSAAPVAPASAAPVVDPQVVKAGVATLRRYLHVWETQGTIASGRYLVREERPRGSDDHYPRLVSSHLASYDVKTWDGPEHFVLQVKLSRTFDGFTDPFALAAYVHWDQSAPQFVTVTRTDRGRYLLSFKTSP